MEHIKLFENFDSSNKFDIVNTKDMNVKDAEKIISDHWTNGLTYKGHEFFDQVYMKDIYDAASDYLKVGIECDGQESYLGYLADEDMFISGWDLGSTGYDEEEEDCTNIAFIKLDDKLNVISIEDSYKGFTGTGGFYYDGIYNELKKKFPEIIDIRLD